MPLPTKKTVKQTDFTRISALIYGLPGAGKCLKKDTKMIHSLTKRIVTLEQLVNEQDSTVLTVDLPGIIKEVKPIRYIKNEPAQLYKLKTQTGRFIEATANHPFLTRDGWKQLKDLNIDEDRVAVVVEYESCWGGTKTNDSLVKVIAYLLADGHITESGCSFTKDEEVVINDFVNSVNECGDGTTVTYFENKASTVRVIHSLSRKYRSGIHKFLEDVGLGNKRSKDKFIPEFVFGLHRDKTALFLNRLFTCDGCIEETQRLSYSSTSHLMVQQIQHLLTRFGINCLIRDKYLNDELYGSELIIAQKEDIIKFYNDIGLFGSKQEKFDRIIKEVYIKTGKNTHIDRVGNFVFDRIKSIEATTIEEVYDLEIEGTHNFIANDFVVHNSTFLSNIPNCVIGFSEAGYSNLEVFPRDLTSWEDVLAFGKELVTEKHNFTTVAFDTIDNIFKFCTDYICKKKKVEYIADVPGFAVGHTMVNLEFHRVMNQFARLPMGFFCVSHAKETEIETRKGKVKKIIPTLSSGANLILTKLVDQVLYFDLSENKTADNHIEYERVIRTKPTTMYFVKNRFEHLPDTIPMNYEKFVEAFNTKQEIK